MYPAPKRVPRKYLRRAKAKKYNIPLALVYLRRVAMVCLVVLSVAFGVLITVEGVRDEIKNTIITWYEKCVNFDYSSSDVPAPTKENTAESEKDPNETEGNGDDTENSETVGMYDLTIGYVPSRFELADVTETPYQREYIYYLENGDYLIIEIADSNAADISFDSEQSEYEKFTIDGREIHVLYNETEKCGNVITGNSSYYIAVGGMCEKEELIKIIENIK